MIYSNYMHVSAIIAEAAKSCGRKATDIKIVAVSKMHPVEDILELAEKNVRIFGESRLQEAVPKIDIVKERYPSTEFHFIGQLQRNKIKKIIDYFDMIQSVDTIDKAYDIDRYAGLAGKRQDILIQLNLADEPQKGGVSAELLEGFMESIKSYKNIRVKGFMFIPPFIDNPEENRRYFIQSREIYDKYRQDVAFKEIDTLSIGMSDDFEVAISEKSNMVRIGTMIFGKR